jgi:hypothetical protein
MALRLVSSNTKRIEIGEEDFIVVREDISRRAFTKLLMKLPQGTEAAEGIDFATATSFAEGLFDAFVVEWSVEDEKGKNVKPTLDNYNLLSREAATAIDTAVTGHFNSLTPDAQEEDKSEEPSEE